MPSTVLSEDPHDRCACVAAGSGERALACPARSSPVRTRSDAVGDALPVARRPFHDTVCGPAAWGWSSTVARTVLPLRISHPDGGLPGEHVADGERLRPAVAVRGEARSARRSRPPRVRSTTTPHRAASPDSGPSSADHLDPVAAVGDDGPLEVFPSQTRLRGPAGRSELREQRPDRGAGRRAHESHAERGAPGRARTRSCVISPLPSPFGVSTRGEALRPVTASGGGPGTGASTAARRPRR